MDKKYIVFRQKTIELIKNEDGYWEDEKGTIYAFADPTSSVDDKPQCGVGLLTLPDFPFFREINRMCGRHDYLYESPVYQAFHNRSEADVYLEMQLAAIGHPLVGEVMSQISEDLGAPFWENEKTRDK